MNWPVVIAALWVLAATVVALLPMRMQYVPGVALLLVAPVLIIWLAVLYGWWVGVLALLAFISMFRNPLRYLLARARGQRPEIPK
jgi:fatty acid desaturase